MNNLCKSMSVTDTDVNNPEMVNKQKFIEKVYEKLKSMFHILDCGNYDFVGNSYITVEEFIEDFKKYMEE